MSAVSFPQILDDEELAWIIETDDPNELRELHDRLTDQLTKVDWRIRELEDRDARAEEMGLRRDYFASVL